MAKFMIVPPDDYAVLRKYLGESETLILMPEEILSNLPPKAQKKARELDEWGDVDYGFGGEPDVLIDIILSDQSYAYSTLLAKDDEDEDEDGDDE